MIYWAVVGNEVLPFQAERLVPVMTAWGLALVNRDVEPHVYVSMTRRSGLGTFRSYLHKQHAEESLKAHWAGFNPPTPAKVEPKTLTFKAGKPVEGPPKVGDVYKCKGGKKTAYWLVVGIDHTSANLLGFNHKGEISSTTTYGVHVLYGHLWSRDKLGTVADFPHIKFTI